MKKNLISLICLLLAIVMVTGALASCKNGDITTESSVAESTEATTAASNQETTSDGTEYTSEKKTENTSENNTEVTTEENTEMTFGEYHSDLIEISNKHANSVQAQFADNSWNTFIVSNENMSYAYTLPTEKDQRVSYIKNAQGKSYIENTMDVFVRLTDSDRIFASTSSEDAIVNVFRFGYYYYDTRIEGQDFAGTLKILQEEEVPLGWTYLSQVTGVEIVDGVLRGQTTTKSDPFIIFGEKFSYDTSQYNYIQVTMKTDSVTSLALYYIAGKQSNFNSSQKSGFPPIIADGEYHTYTLKLSSLNDYTDLLKGIRLDFDGGEIGASFEISSIKLIKGEEQGVTTLRHARILHTYSDKLNQVVQIAATETTRNIAEIGMLTEIDASTVSKLVVKDGGGIHDTLDDVDWNSAEYVGFDIIDVGIFGYILLKDDTSGKLTVTLDDGIYSIVQSRTPDDNTILVGEGSPDDREGKAGNNNDFYMGQRIYTDENHTFDAFIKEAEAERNPLTAKNIKVSTAYSANGSFLGYNALRGCYEFIIDGTDFNNAYDRFQNRHYNLNFTIKGADTDRVVYFMVESRSSGLECAALLDENLMMLPVPLEVGKNFGGDGDYNIFDRLDNGYGETIFPIIADSDETREYTLVNLFQNWGNFPLKQLSFIEYHSPYYHLSTGVTESNCLVPWKFTSNPAIPNLLPDHRSMSAPFWPSGPQHTSSGSHTFLHYYDEKQNRYDANLVSQNIDSYGPTYVDLEMTHLSGDNKIKITYHHIEMPDTDENRAYYTMEYEFLEDLTLNEVSSNLYFYSIGSSTGVPYEQIGWLDENNQSQIAKFSDIPSGTTYVLGSECPYFDLFDLKDNTDYGNVSFLVYNHNVVIDGKSTDTKLAVHKSNSSLRLTLDLNNVTFKAGDKITINAIIMPWGSQDSDYSGKNYAPDQNVRDVRDNTLLNPVIGSAVADCEKIEHVFIPKFRTTNGKSAEFTISGGKANQHTIKNRDGSHTMAVRIYGFTELTVPKVYQKVNDEWVAYELSSANNLDKSGFGAYYDGYNVYYDEDGTYSYSFIVDVSDGKDKTFKIELDEDFEKWPLIFVDESTLVVESPFNVFWDAKGFQRTCYQGWFSKIERNFENDVEFVSMYAHKSYPESQVNLYKNSEGEVTGQYLVVKYRLPVTNPNEFALEFFASTVNPSATSGDSYVLGPDQGLCADGKWHVAVIDLSSYNKSGFVEDSDGNYKISYIRFDPINGQMPTENRVDIAYIAIHDNLDDIIDFNADQEEIILVTNGRPKNIATK